jgi:hypothetical protein
LLLARQCREREGGATQHAAFPFHFFCTFQLPSMPSAVTFLRAEMPLGGLGRGRTSRPPRKRLGDCLAASWLGSREVETRSPVAQSIHSVSPCESDTVRRCREQAGCVEARCWVLARCPDAACDRALDLPIGRGGRKGNCGHTCNRHVGSRWSADREISGDRRRHGSKHRCRSTLSVLCPFAHTSFRPLFTGLF